MLSDPSSLLGISTIVNIFDLVFPKRCVGCGKVGRYFCSRCSASIRSVSQNETICPMCEKPAMDGATHPRCRSRYSIDGLTSFFHYRGIVQKAVKTLKYRLVSDLAEEFVEFTVMDSRLTHQGPGNDMAMLAPIPLHSSRKRYRGFNQAEVLGQKLAEKWRVPLRTDILTRVLETTSQVEVKDREKRLKNLEKAFAVISDVHGSSILLFDDVWTTGATMRSAGNALKRGGVVFVWGITMAR